MGLEHQSEQLLSILKRRTVWEMRIARSRSGQSLAEYGLALSLVAVACLGALMLVGDNLGGMLSEIRMLVTGQSKTEALASGSLSGDVGQTASAQPSSALTKTCYSNGWCINLTQNQMSQLSTPQTAGANGTGMVSSQADVLLQLAQQAANDPMLDPALKDLLTKLANSGHNSANLLNIAVEDYSNFQPYYQANPDDYDDSDLAAHTAWNEWMINKMLPCLKAGIDFHNDKAVTLDYLNQHSGALPSDIEQILNAAMSSIASQLTYMGSYDSGAYGGQTDNWNLVWEYEQQANTVTSPDVVIHQESNTICTNGGDTSQCVQPISQ